MKSIIAFSALFAAALAQSSAGTTTNTASTPTESCLNACSPGDVNCQAICVGVPHPGSVQMNQTTNCVAQCDQGDGSKSASDAYAACRNACISSYIITSGTAAPGGAYTTAVPLGVSTTAASTAASGSSGMYMTHTLKVDIGGCGPTAPAGCFSVSATMDPPAPAPMEIDVGGSRGVWPASTTIHLPLASGSMARWYTILPTPVTTTLTVTKPFGFFSFYPLYHPM